MKLVRAFVAAAAALTIGAAIQLVVSSSPASAKSDNTLCIACWAVIEE